MVQSNTERFDSLDEIHPGKLTYNLEPENHWVSKENCLPKIHAISFHVRSNAPTDPTDRIRSAPLAASCRVANKRGKEATNEQYGRPKRDQRRPSVRDWTLKASKP